MYKHVVFWKIKEEVKGIKKAELISEVLKKLDTLPAIIPEIKEYETAVNIGDYGASFYDICLISIFENRDTFWNYTKYPEHDAVVEYIQSVQEGEQIVDFEF
jgi:hypothetical protein